MSSSLFSRKFYKAELKLFYVFPYDMIESRKSCRDNPEITVRTFSHEISECINWSRYHDLELDAVPFSRTLSTRADLATLRDLNAGTPERRLAGAPSSYCLSAARRRASLFASWASTTYATPRRVGLAQPPSERPRTAPNERRLAAYVAITAESHLRSKDQSSLSRYYRICAPDRPRFPHDTRGMRRIRVERASKDSIASR